MDNSNRSSNKSVALKGSKNSNPPNLYNYYSYSNTLTTITASTVYSINKRYLIKEESIREFYDNNKENKVTFNI